MKQIIIGLSLLLLIACSNHKRGNQITKNPLDQLQSSDFKTIIEGKATDLYFLQNANGAKAAITNYGGRIVGLTVPDQYGNPVDVVIGMKSVDAYRKATEPYFGALIGRVGNRIAKGQFSLDGKSYELYLNNGPNSLHGGNKGFQYVVWDAVQLNDSTLTLNYLSKDGEENYPGNLKVSVTYRLNATNGLEISYTWQSDARTVANLTNHAFFNLNGEGSGSINDHYLTINADKYTPVDATLIPTGELTSVKETPFDFTKGSTIGARLDTTTNEQLKFGKGYDHNYRLNKLEGKLEWAAKIIGDKTGIIMDVYTTEPGLQFYGGNFMQSKNTLKYGEKDHFRTAFCLETQHFPDAPNQAHFPSIVVEPQQVYSSQTIYQFSAKPQ